ncbi:MAG: bifunctional UDP-N-acetylglucosamine diphosphorylase/glucosamine-1-phosphate N-acetyltransferase GlmU [Clostridiaceae bacterium]
MINCALILAAGQGKRIKSKLPKVLHKVCGKEMVNHVIDTMREAGFHEVNVIIGKGAERVKSDTSSREVSYSLQEEQLGTGHAVMCAADYLKDKKGTVAIFTGDAPLIQVDTVKSLLAYHEQEKNSATLLSSIISDPTGYGRIVRNGSEVIKIVEHKDCTPAELNINEINAGMYLFDIEELLASLKLLSNNNSQGEYYLTDVIGILKAQGKRLGALPVDFQETLGVNSRGELAVVEEIMRKRINKKHMANGVTIIDPQSTYIGIDVKIGQDTIIYPNNVLEGKTIVGEDCILYPNCRICDSIIKDNVTVQGSVILNSQVGEGTDVGPFAYIRPDSIIGKNTRIGDFVEIKKATIGDGTKVSHLTYIGDAEVGKDCNFGCGTVVVNYDGNKKHKTIVGDNVFIGCNTNLVSPVVVKDNSYTAAGSTITKEVPQGSLAIARAKQINIDGWVEKRGLFKKKSE